MEDNTFALMEKMYSEILELKEETNKNFQRLESKLDEDITPKIAALFDGYKANSERLDEISEKVDRLRHDFNNLSMKVARNDSRIIKIRRDLESAE